MRKVTVDTDVLIDILTSKSIPAARRAASIRFVKEKIEFGEHVGYVSAFTCLEIFGGAKSEHASAEKLLSLFNVVNLDCELGKKSGIIRRASGANAGDALIAASALSTASDYLATWNKEHYRNIKNLKVKTPAEALRSK